MLIHSRRVKIQECSQNTNMGCSKMNIISGIDQIKSNEGRGWDWKFKAGKKGRQSERATEELGEIT